MVYQRTDASINANDAGSLSGPRSPIFVERQKKGSILPNRVDECVVGMFGSAIRARPVWHTTTSTSVPGSGSCLCPNRLLLTWIKTRTLPTEPPI